MKKILIAISLGMILMAGSCEPENSAAKEEAAAVEKQQEQYAIAQPVPAYDYSLERDLLIQLYNIRNQEVTTHSVWRSNYGMIEGDCRSMGFGMPYDTSLTNPLTPIYRYSNSASSAVVVSQPEPNGVFASTNTSATWVFCVSDSGGVEPIYVESKVTVYPGPVKIDYSNNRVIRNGQATVQLELPK
jgi:hypothetical protein